MMNDPKKFVSWAEACKMTQDGPAQALPHTQPGFVERAEYTKAIASLIQEINQLRAEVRELKGKE